MIERYENGMIEGIWSDQRKVFLWQQTELAVLEAKTILGRIPQGIFKEISSRWMENPIDLKVWHELELRNDHDLNAFLEERAQCLTDELARYVHEDMTSYDTEEPAFARRLKESAYVIVGFCDELSEVLIRMAEKYRYTIMNGRTHGQEAELQSFGKRCVSWRARLQVDIGQIELAQQNLRYSKLSGAIGNYTGIDPELEQFALKLLGMEPFLGATQIMPRELYLPLASALVMTVSTMEQIATDIKLGARSGRPIYREPFKKTQKGSSAMPQKKNTIKSENVGGMARSARGFLSMITETIATWEERSIEQSSVERIAWPDLFHVTARALGTMIIVLKGLQVYPDTMLLEIVESRGCYASGPAKELLAELILAHGGTREDAYRIVQLAAFNVFEPSPDRQWFRDNIATSIEGSATAYLHFAAMSPEEIESIEDVIPAGKLRVSSELAASASQIDGWNSMLIQIFSDKAAMNRWYERFSPIYLLRNEGVLFASMYTK